MATATPWLMLTLFLSGCGKKDLSLDSPSKPSSDEIIKAKEETKGRYIGNYTYKNQLFENVKVRDVTPEGFEVAHKHGNSTFLFHDMPRAVQWRFGYEPPVALAAVPAPGLVPMQPATAAAGSSAPSLEALKTTARKKEISARELANREVLQAEASSLRSTVSQLQTRLNSLREDKANAQSKHYYARWRGQISSWPAVVKRIDMNMDAVQQKLNNARAHLDHVETRLAE